MQHVVHVGLVFVGQQLHVQVQDGHQTAVQRGEQRRGLDRLLRAREQETAPQGDVYADRLRRGGPAGRADIRAARRRVVLRAADGEPGRHLADVGQRAADGQRPLVVGHRAPHIDIGQLPGGQPPPPPPPAPPPAVLNGPSTPPPDYYRVTTAQRRR